MEILFSTRKSQPRIKHEDKELLEKIKKEMLTTWSKNNFNLIGTEIDPRINRNTI